MIAASYDFNLGFSALHLLIFEKTLVNGTIMDYTRYFVAANAKKLYSGTT